MKLAIVNQHASTGGWRYLSLLCKNIKLLRPDYDITIYIDVINGSEHIIEQLKNDGLKFQNIARKVRIIKPFVKKQKFKNKFLNKWANSIRKRLYKLHKDRYIDSIQNFLSELNNFDAVFYAWPYDIDIFAQLNIPLFFIPHDFIFTHFFGFHSGHVYTREWWQRQYQQLKGFVDKGGQPIVSSPYIADEYNRVYPESVKKPQVVYLSSFNDYPILEQDQIKKVLDKFNIKDDYILYANNWALHKNMQEVIGAFYLVKQKYPHIKLIITGYGTDNIICQCNSPYYLDHVREDEKYDVKSLGLLNEDDFSAILQGAKMCINSSLCEAGSGSSLDAWNVKIPVVISDIPPFRQQVEFLGTKAEFFNPRNSTDMAEAILRILDNPQKAKHDVEMSYQSIKKYTWKTIAEQYVNIFEKNLPDKKILQIKRMFPNANTDELICYLKIIEEKNG